jgi:hypothetical protein
MLAAGAPAPRAIGPPPILPGAPPAPGPSAEATLFLTLLLVTFGVALLVSFLVTRLFSASLRRILDRIVAPDLAGAWHRYLVFALYVVGVSGGVRIWSLEQYVNPRDAKTPPLVLTPDRWTLELFRTVIETLQSAAWMLLVAFAVLLVAYVVARGMEQRAARHADRAPAA